MSSVVIEEVVLITADIIVLCVRLRRCVQTALIEARGLKEKGDEQQVYC